jgi:hypothetical protein
LRSAAPDWTNVRVRPQACEDPCSADRAIRLRITGQFF